MTINNFTPSLWAGRAQANLNDAHVYANTMNRDYEGDFSAMGDRVHIQSIGRPTIRTFTKNAAISAPETLQDSDQILIIDQGQYFNFEVDDVDAVQNKIPVMDAAMREAAWGLADTVDDAIAALLVAGVASGNKLTALTTVGGGVADDDAYEALVDLDVQLTEQNVPRTGDRYVVVPPWYEGELRKDVRFISFGTKENRAQLRGRPVGEASGFNVWVSNNVPVTASAYTLVAGYTGAATFAEQIVKTVAFKPEDSFSDAIKGLHIYGYKVTRPHALASVVVTQAT